MITRYSGGPSIRGAPSFTYSAVTPASRRFTSSMNAGGKDHSRPTISPTFVVAMSPTVGFVDRIGLDGVREPLAVEVANPTSVALGPDGLMYISSRFDGHVHRLTADDRVELYATELGVPTGLAFAPDGTLFVGDRSGSILRVSPDRQVETYASLPASVAAFHLSYGPDDCLYATAPTLATHDPVYRITRERLVDVVCDGFGRPQGLAFDASGALYVADALAGGAGLYRIDLSPERPKPELVLSAPMLVGVAFDPRGGLVLASNDTIWKLDVDLKPLTMTA